MSRQDAGAATKAIRVVRLILAALVAAALPLAAQAQKPDTDPDSPIVNRALRFSGEQPPYRVMIEYPWFAGEGQVPSQAANAAIARTVLDWAQQFSNLHTRAETDQAGRPRTGPARLEVSFRILRPTQRLVCIVYTRTVNDGRASEDRVSVATDLIDAAAFRPVGLADLMEGERWLNAVAERVDLALREEAQRRQAALFGSVQVRDWLREGWRWQFDRRGATVHFAPGEVAAEAAGRFEIAVPYAAFAGAIRRRGPLGALAPKEPEAQAQPPAHDLPPRRRQ
jgi:hypothetical protein